MMPNAWFYKLKDMGKPKPTNKKKHFTQTPTLPHQQQQFTNHRQSYYFTSEPFHKPDKLYNSPVNPKSSDVHFPDPPRKSPRRKSTRRRRTTGIKSTKLATSSSSVSAGCGCRVTAETDSTLDYSPSPPDTSPDRREDEFIYPDPDSDTDVVASWSTSSCSCRVSSSATDIIIDVDSKDSRHSSTSNSKYDGFDRLDLPPILTKPAKFSDMVSEIKKRDTQPVRVQQKRVINSPEKKISPQTRKITPNSPGLKLRSNSPRIASKKIRAYSRKTLTRKNNLSDSFAVIKSSNDPQKDFRESMVEMIIENNIRASKDLEELLACYLSLNSNEYHDTIVKVFEQIWFDLTDIQL